MLSVFRLSLCLVLLPAIALPLSAADTPFRLAISERIVRGININDARAAMTLWGKEIVNAAGFQIVRGQDWVLPSTTLLANLRAGKMDMVCITVEEFMQVRDAVDNTDVITDERGGQELLVIVRRDTSLNTLADLRGRSLIVLDAASTLLADAWLGTELHRAGLPSATRHFAKITRNIKPAQVVLPVFFGQADAAIVPRETLKTMVEMNPQLGRAVKIVATSPQLVSVFFTARRTISPATRNRIYERVLSSKADTANRQILTLFRARGYARCTAACLQPSIDLLENFYRIEPDARTTKPRSTEPRSTEPGSTEQ